MKDFKEKVAFVTGGGSGIGLEIGRSLAKQGAHVMLADMNAERLVAAKADLLKIHPNIETVTCNVGDASSVQSAADATIARFGKVHIVVNNAGVGLAGNPGALPLADWRWIIDINLMGVVHGVEIFTPLMRSHGEGGYFVNTASMAGHVAAPQLLPYNATKFAVVGLSETLKQDFAKENINVSVLCPGFVKTNIAQGNASRPTGVLASVDEANIKGAKDAAIAVANGISPQSVAEWTLECMKAGRFYIFTAPELVPLVDLRMAAIQADYAEATKYFGNG